MAGAAPPDRHRAERKEEKELKPCFPVLAVVLLLAWLPAFAKDETTAELKARAEATTGDQQSVLYAQVVQREIEDANQLFTVGEVEKAQSTVKEAVRDAEKARDAALERSRKIKDTEIHLRKAEHRLNDIRRTLALEDQPAVQEAVDQIAAVRKQLLDVMFSPKRKK